MILMTPNADAAEQIAEDVTVFLTEGEPEYRLNHVLLFPAMKQRDDESETALEIADEAFGERIKVLKQLAGVKDRFIVVASMPALLQPVPPPELFKEQTQTLTVNSRIDLESLCRLLLEGGYRQASTIDMPGEFSVRGYILDMFAPDWDEPVRVECVGGKIKSLRRFDMTTQRSLENIGEVDLTRLQFHKCADVSLLDYFPSSTPIVLIEPAAFGHLSAD